MNWYEHVFDYCERGLDASFWAEPLNATSNIAFVVAAVLALVRIGRLGRPGDARRRRYRHALIAMACLVAAMGVGSFVFHTWATRWAKLADATPITVFMLVYLAYALRVFLRMGWLPVGVALAAFLYLSSATADLQCSTALSRIAEPCFNGSLGYLPALATLFLVSGLMWGHAPEIARRLLSAGLLFTVSLVLRSIDRELCAAMTIGDWSIGTHALWHVCNAATVFWLLDAAIRHDAADQSGR